jgi:hypothetical protein
MLSVVAARIQEQAPAPFDANQQSWDIAVIGARVEAMAEENWFGGPNWVREGVVFRCAGGAQTVECQVLDQGDFETNDLRFQLGPQEASVQIGRSSDVMLGPLQDVGGMACLVSNGTDTVLEYEIHAVYGGHHLRSLCGAVTLHGAGRQLALDLAMRRPAEGRSPFDRFAQITSVEDRSESHGYLDEFGRKDRRCKAEAVPLILIPRFKKKIIF